MSVATATTIHGYCDPRFSRVREAFDENFRDSEEVGASVCVMLAGEPVVDLWAGWADAARSRPWQTNTIVNVWSTTKGMTALCLHLLAERGLVDFEAPVARYWPEFAQAGKGAITVRQLMTHQAGLPAVDGPLPDGAALDWEYMTRALERQRPYWEPGTGVGYHAVTFGWLLGEVVRRVTGRSLKVFFREEVARPLQADFSIGCAAEDDWRTADVLYPPGRTSAMPDNAAREYNDPDSMTYKAMATLITPPVNAPVNSRAWRDAEFPAMNGHANPRGIARVYGAIANAGTLDGAAILGSAAIDAACALAVETDRDLTMLVERPIRRSLGYVLGNPAAGDVRGLRSIGHGGAGGSLGFADPEKGIGFGYAMNQMLARSASDPDVRAARLAAAAYASL